ncbi:response regulator [Thermogemmata fonticola]|jgi:CheY-like chemotaxis protein|uniref:Response regulator n=1 Tax=Thermogemmata fonticola TaxID=2755323 RepID=A0A7V9AB29_9BACT|nr:response regulator [Thermogemmata fonticola]MBA2225786.1 response regulator [Thermogemmata fonticola]
MTHERLVILLAEDDDGHAQLIERNLKRAGVVNPIVRVADGQAALDYIRQGGNGQPLLLLLDINLPRVDGIEVLRQLKADPHTSKLPVIMLTTTDDPREVDRCYALGCSVYITKPVRYESFVEALRRLGMFLEIVKLPSPPSSPSA